MPGVRFTVPHSGPREGAGGSRSRQIPPGPPPPARAHVASAELLERLWGVARRADRIEIHLRDGTKLSPERLLKDASGPGYAVFVSREPDGTMTLTAVAWDAITRVVVGGFNELPASLAE